MNFAKRSTWYWSVKPETWTLCVCSGAWAKSHRQTPFSTPRKMHLFVCNLIRNHFFPLIYCDSTNFNFNKTPLLFLASEIFFRMQEFVLFFFLKTYQNLKFKTMGFGVWYMHLCSKQKWILLCFWRHGIRRNEWDIDQFREICFVLCPLNFGSLYKFTNWLFAKWKHTYTIFLNFLGHSGKSYSTGEVDW